MTPNDTNISLETLLYKLFNVKILLVQVLVSIFLYVNALMIFIFLRKEVFHSDTRYVLFAHMLFIDSSLMVLTDFAVASSNFQLQVPSIPCILLCVAMDSFSLGTPLTLVAMCLERYVAICMPLRHAVISNASTRMAGLLLIWVFSFVPSLIELCALAIEAPPGFWLLSIICSMNALDLNPWLTQLRTALAQLYFLVLSTIIVFTYVKIMAVARAASLDSKKSSTKCLRTVVLHAFQLFLCSIQFWCPFIESFLIEIDFKLFLNVRYADFILFIIAPRCLNLLIYGIRDEKFFNVMKYYFCFHTNKQISPFLGLEAC